MRKFIACLLILAASAVTAFADPGSPDIGPGWIHAAGGGANTYVLLMGNENANNGTTFGDQCNSGAGCPHTLSRTTGTWAAPTGTWPGCCTAPSFVVGSISSAGGLATSAASSDWNVSAGASWTLGIWVAVANITSAQGIVSIGTWGSTDVLQVISAATTGLINFWLSSTGSTWDIANAGSTATNLDTNWHYIEIDFDGAHYYVSVDGTITNTITSSSHLFFDATNSKIYCGNAFGNIGMSGQIASCFFHTGSALHTANFTAPQVPVAH